MIAVYLLYGIWDYSIFAPIEMLVAELMFLIHLKKKKHFEARLAAVSVFYLLFLLLIPPYYKSDFIDEVFTDVFVNLYSMGYWFLGYVLSIFLFFLCFDTDKRNVLFYCATGYCTQHIVTAVWRIVLLFVNFGNPLANLAVEISVCASVYCFVWFFSARKLKYNLSLASKNGHVALFSTLAILLNTVLSMCCRLEQVGLITEIVENMYSIVSCALVLILQFSVSSRRELQYELDMVSRMWEKDREQYELRKEYIDAVNVKFHDLKHVWSTMQEVDSGYMEEMKRTLDAYDLVVNTGNEALDVVLSEKSVSCKNNGIHLTCMVNGAKLHFMENADIYSCLGNALDNAIEAVSALPEEKRSISVSMVEQGDLLLLCVENYFAGEIKLKNGFPVTTKRDAFDHGFGFKSMKHVAEKYGGKISFSSANNIFTLNLFLPYVHGERKQ